MPILTSPVWRYTEVCPFLCSIVVPPEGYLARVHALCKKHNVLLICDEIQTVNLLLATAPIHL